MSPVLITTGQVNPFKIIGMCLGELPGALKVYEYTVFFGGGRNESMRPSGLKTTVYSKWCSAAFVRRVTSSCIRFRSSTCRTAELCNVCGDCGSFRWPMTAVTRRSPRSVRAAFKFHNSAKSHGVQAIADR